jgi:hypothetical protein
MGSQRKPEVMISQMQSDNTATAKIGHRSLIQWLEGIQMDGMAARTTPQTRITPSNQKYNRVSFAGWFLETSE